MVIRLVRVIAGAALVVLAARSASAQVPVPVAPWADWASYGTALVNPVTAAVSALTSHDKVCRLGQLGISELVGNVATLTLKRLIVSPRPCLGCAPDGMPSGHTMNSTIGFSSRWKVGVLFSVGTAELRADAHRHTPWQVAAGAAIGVGAEAAGHLLRCP
jgi:membrane-associated phospholipid phosphatase